MEGGELQMTETIQFGIVVDGGEIEGNEGQLNYKELHFSSCTHELTEVEIEFVKKELPELLKKGESLHLNTHVDHDDYFVIEVVRNHEWPNEKYCEVRVFSYREGSILGGYSEWIDLTKEDEIQEFVESIFK